MFGSSHYFGLGNTTFAIETPQESKDWANILYISKSQLPQSNAAKVSEFYSVCTLQRDIVLNIFRHSVKSTTHTYIFMLQNQFFLFPRGPKRVEKSIMGGQNVCP